MKKKAIILSSILLVAAYSHASVSISLDFTANHTCTYAQLDSILIENLSMGGDTTLYWNDTVLTFSWGNIDIYNVNNTRFHVYQNYPNPFENKTNISVYVPEKDEVSLSVFDLTGRKLSEHQNNLIPGMHNFTFYGGLSNIYILSVKYGNEVRHLKMLQSWNSGNSVPKFEYTGISMSDDLGGMQPEVRTLRNYFSWEIGEELRFTGYVKGDYAVITDSPSNSTSYFFDIANQLPANPSPITGATNVCENRFGYYYQVSHQPHVIFEWTLPEGWQINSGFNSSMINVTSGTESGEISVRAVNACGESEYSLLYVTVHSGPEIDLLSDVEACDYYELPELTNGSYFSQPFGMEPITDHLITETETIFIYAETETPPFCYSENSFTVTIHNTPIPDNLSDVAACDSYQLPSLNVGNYFAESDGVNPITNFQITQSQTIYVYAETGTEPNCFAEESFEVTINYTPTIESPADVEACQTFDLPELSIGNYYFEPGGVSPVTNYQITHTQTIYVYAETGTEPNCFAEESFEVFIFNSVPSSPLAAGNYAGLTSIKWNWTEVPGAAGYKYNSEEDYATAIDNGLQTYFHQTGLEIDNEYKLYVWAYNLCGESAALSLAKSTGYSGCPDYFLDDRDGKLYSALQIGNQCWIGENLKYLPVVHSNFEFYSVGIGGNPAYGVYGYNGSDVEAAKSHDNFSIYGVLYNWRAAMANAGSSSSNPSGIQGACPDGWHLPSDDEWKELEMHLGMSQADADETGYRGTNEGSKLAGNQALWQHSALTNNAQFNSSGFKAIPGGWRQFNDGAFMGLGTNARFWSATEKDNIEAWLRIIRYDDSRINRSAQNKRFGYYVRCVLD